MQQNDKATLGWLWRISGKQKLNIGILMVMQVVSSLCTVAMAWFLRGMINQAVDQNRTGFFYEVAGLLLIICLQIVSRAVIRYLLEWNKSSLENRFKERLFSQILYRNFEKINQCHSGEWMNRLTSDTVVVADGLTTILPESMGMLAKMTGGVVLLLILLPQVAWVMVPAGVAMIILTYIFRKTLKQLHKKIQETDGSLRIYLTEHISNLLIVHSFGQENQTLRQAADYMESHQRARMRRNFFSNVCNIGFGVLMHGIYAGGAIYCGYGILIGTISYGTFVAVLQLINQIQSPFANITGYLPKYYAMLASAERLMSVEAYELEIVNQDTARETSFDEICFENVYFSYDDAEVHLSDIAVADRDEYVLKNIHFSIKRGDYVAITGLSGGGKSTLLKLLMCLYQVKEGERFLLSGSDKVKMEPEHRTLFAYVPQGNQLLSGSIREVLTFGDESMMKREELLWDALEIACMKDVVQELPDRLETQLGERGQGLSEGQIQRIAIARAICSGHPIIVLDEATSSLDGGTEKMLLENIRTMTERTVIIVTHRNAALEICNRQFEIKDQQLREVR